MHYIWLISNYSNIHNHFCYYYITLKKHVGMMNLRMCYYFDDINRFEDFNFDNIITDEKLRENILIYNISYKTLIGAKSLRIKFNKIEGFITIVDGNRYLTWFGYKKYDSIYKLDIL